MTKKKATKKKSGKKDSVRRKLESVLKEVLDPGMATSTEALALIAGKREADEMYGLAGPSDKFDRSGRCVGPYGGANVKFTCIEENEKNGKRTGQAAIVFYVETKSTSADEADIAVIPPTIRGIPTDVCEIGEVSLQGLPLERGSSIFGAPRIGGTIGAFVKRKGMGDIGFILTNQHVLAPGGIGEANSAVFANGTNTKVGELRVWSEPTESRRNLIDGAVAVTKSKFVNLGGGGFQLNPNPVGNAELVARARDGLRVKKLGAVTGLTDGVIAGVDSKTPIGNRIHLFETISIQVPAGQRFSRDGDSGSLVVTESDNRPIGLLYGALRNRPNISLASRIQNVMDILHITEFATSTNPISP